MSWRNTTEFTGLPDAPKFDKKLHKVRMGQRQGVVTIVRAEGITHDGPWVFRCCVLWDDGTDGWYEEWDLEDADER